MTTDQYEFKYMDGFNMGYTLGRYEQDLYKTLMKRSNTEHPYFKGMEDGNVAAQKAIFKQQLTAKRVTKQTMKRQFK